MKRLTRNLLLVLANLMASAVLLEIATPWVYSHIAERAFEKQSLREKLQSYTAAEEEGVDLDRKLNRKFATANFIENKVIHPYLGFVYDTSEDVSNRAGNFGFHDTSEILNNSKDTVKIVVTGGSVARGLLRNAQGRILENLRASGIYGDRRLQIFSLSIDGFKQPQQLMALNYFLMLGGEFDTWINLDGFNEIALPISDNFSANVATAFPRAWYFHARKSLEKGALDKMVDIETLRRARKRFARLLASTFLSQSAFSLAVWELYDQKLENEEYQRDRELKALVSRDDNPSYQVTGPVITGRKPQDILLESIGIWQRTSILMAYICAASGINYFHFLQPNQYLVGSKTFTEQEKATAYESGPYDFKEIVEAGYPILIREGKRLKKAGVSFVDLTMMFKDEARTIYSDKCCHFNPLGYGLIADRISDAMIRAHKKNARRVEHRKFSVRSGSRSKYGHAPLGPSGLLYERNVFQTARPKQKHPAPS